MLCQHSGTDRQANGDVSPITIRIMPQRLSGLIAAAVVAFLAPRPAFAASTAPQAVPPWLVIGAGAVARVDIAPWLDSDEPEAALTLGADSLRRDFSADATRPGDVLYEPIGVRVRVVKLQPGGRLALVRGITDHFEGYAPRTRLIPEIPAGTGLVAAGGFGGFADFYPALDTPQKRAARLATGSRLVALGTGVAPYDPDSADLVRVRVRVLDGNLRGRTGWVAVVYTGLPERRLPNSAEVAEKACGCLLIAFQDS
jgi:hypothetical protein